MHKGFTQNSASQHTHTLQFWCRLSAQKTALNVQVTHKQPDAESGERRNLWLQIWPQIAASQPCRGAGLHPANSFVWQVRPFPGDVWSWDVFCLGKALIHGSRRLTGACRQEQAAGRLWCGDFCKAGCWPSANPSMFLLPLWSSSSLTFDFSPLLQGSRGAIVLGTVAHAQWLDPCGLPGHKIRF